MKLPHRRRFLRPAAGAVRTSQGPVAVAAARPVVAVASDTAAALALPSDLLPPRLASRCRPQALAARGTSWGLDDPLFPATKIVVGDTRHFEVGQGFFRDAQRNMLSGVDRDVSIFGLGVQGHNTQVEWQEQNRHERISQKPG
jgi:hypothetical protein